jgi:hypothetical protein
VATTARLQKRICNRRLQHDFDFYPKPIAYLHGHDSTCSRLCGEGDEEEEFVGLKHLSFDS